jgi:pimeloyl-ACP methyl ester carboxylesterase
MAPGQIAHSMAWCKYLTHSKSKSAEILNPFQTGLMGDPIFDTFYSSNLQFASNTTAAETTMKAAGAALLDKIGPSILLSHSQGGLFPWLWADARPALVKGIVSIEPTGPPFTDAVFSTTATRPYGLTNIPMTFTPAVDTTLAKPLATAIQPATAATDGFNCTIQAEPARKLTNLAKVPVLIETAEASYHAVYDACTALFLRQAGVNVTHLKLGDAGIHGNGHMHFMEKNSDDIAAALYAWIKKTVK